MPDEKKRIILRCNRKLHQNISSDTDYLTKASSYTGLHKNTLETLEAQGDIRKIEFNSVDRAVVYDTICRFYVQRRQDGGKLPTTYDLFDALNKMGKLIHMDICSFRKLLRKMDFMWKKLDASNRLVVIEKPEVRFERFNYLTQISGCRAEKYDNIIFVDEAAYNQYMFMDINESRDLELATSAKVWQQRFMCAVGVKNITCLQDVKEFNQAEFEDWILTELCPSLAQPSVIVVQDVEHHNAKVLETPSLYSTKPDIINWLEHHNVMYDEDMSKYELYSLAEEYTDLESTLYKIDGILKARGHTLLRLPKCIKDLSPAVLIFNLIKKNWNLKGGHLALVKAGQDLRIAKSCFSDIVLNSVKYLEEFTIAVIGDEQKMMTSEKDIDLMLDRLMTESSKTYSHPDMEDSDVVSCSDSE